MERIKYFLLALFISPELIILLLAALGLIYFPEVMNDLGKKLQSDSEVWKYLPTLTLFLSGAAFSLSSKIRAPLENSSNKILYEWPLYPLLVDRVMISLVLSGLCGVISLSLWIFGQSMSPEAVGTVFIAATGVSASIAFLMLLAHQKLRELIDRYGSSSS